MIPRDNDERQFLEDVERLLKGEEPLERLADADYIETVLFARRLIELRQEPDQEFAGKLRRNLLTAMASQDAQAQDSRSWFMRLFARPGLRLAMVSTFVVLAAVGLVWRAGLMSTLMPQSSDAPPSMLTAPSAPAVPATNAPEMVRGQTNAADKSADEPAASAPSASPVMLTVYVAPTNASGEDVSIALVFRNEGPDGYSLSPFPPGIVIRDMATGRVVRTFSAGSSTGVISAMESLQYDVIWNQEDDGGRQVQPGRYQVDMESIEARLEKGDMTVSASAYAATAFDILILTTNGTGVDSDINQK